MKTSLSTLRSFILCCLCAVLLLSCSASPARPPSIKVAGAVDVLPLIGGLKRDYTLPSGADVSLLPSTSSIQDLKDGKVDAALVGRALTSAELNGLQDHVVAYDAVCLMLSLRSYLGGLQQPDQKPIEPVSKFVGLRNLSMDELKQYIDKLLRKGPIDWTLPGYSNNLFQAYTNDDGTLVFDPQNPDMVLGMWVWNPIDLSGEMTAPGKFDTQEVLLHSVGYSDADLSNPKIDFFNPYFDNEEELISSRYADTIPYHELMKQSTSWMGFSFFMIPVSRRVLIRAINYGFGVTALSIAGVDPFNPDAIYNGTYPLSRQIHLLTRPSPSPATTSLVQYLLSFDGQQLVTKNGFLPLPKNP